MKIHQLPIGARFEYQGVEYVKTGPLFGTGENGQKLIPKYAVLKPLDAIETGPAKQEPSSLSGDEVLKSFHTFFLECKALVAADRQDALDSARGRFLKALGFD